MILGQEFKVKVNLRNLPVNAWGTIRLGYCLMPYQRRGRWSTIQAAVVAQSLSNFTCNMWMMRGGTLLILGYGVRGQGQIWHSVYKTLWTQYRLQFLPHHFQTLYVS